MQSTRFCTRHQSSFLLEIVFFEVAYLGSAYLHILHGNGAHLPYPRTARPTLEAPAAPTPAAAA